MGGSLALMADAIQTPSSPALAAQQLASTRPRFRFQVPAALRQWPSDPSTVIMREITVAEETRAAEVSGGAGFKFAYECLKSSVIEADGKPVSWDEGGKEKFIEGCSPKVRTLLLRAYDKLHNPQPTDADDFFGSMTAMV